MPKKDYNDMTLEEKQEHFRKQEENYPAEYEKFWDNLSKEILQNSCNSIVNETIQQHEFKFCRSMILAALEYMEDKRRAIEINHF